MKKIISVLVAVLLLCAVIPAAFAADATVFTMSAKNDAEKDYIEKGDIVTVTVYQSGTATSGFKLTGFTYDAKALKLLGEDTDGDGWIEPCTPGTGVAMIAYGPGGVAGGGTGFMTDRVVFTMKFEVLAESGEYYVGFSGAESDAEESTVSGCKIAVGKPHVHVAGEAVKENEVAATCEKAGSYDLVVYCAECGEFMSRETVEVPALGHAWDNGVLPETYDCDDVLKTYTCKNDPSHTKTEDASHKHAIATYTLDRWFAEDGSQWVKQQEKCEHGVEGKDGYHGCSYEGEIKEVQVEGPITGDITPYIAMGVLTMVALVSAAAYMLLKRKAI